MRSLSPVPRAASSVDAATAPLSGKAAAEREREQAGPAASIPRQRPPPALAGPPAPVAPSFFAHDFSRIALRSPSSTLVHPTLQLSTPGDSYEQHADRIADAVMRTPDPRPRHAWNGGGADPPGDPRVQRLQIQRLPADGPGGMSAPPNVHEVIRSPGHPLDAPTRAFMEPRFGRDFSGVRVHTDGRAAQSAASVRARAFTAGSHMVFGAGEYVPASSRGRALLAHELAHTVQQARGIFRRAEEKPGAGPTSPVLIGSSELESVYRGELVIGTRSSGDFVKRIQLALLADDPAALPEFGPDAHFGAETRTAVAAFQQRHGLAVDGVVGPETIRALDQASARTTVASVPGGGTEKKPSVSSSRSPSGLVVISSSKRNPLSPLAPYLPGLEEETTYAVQRFPPVEIPLGTVHRTLSLVGTATLSPSKSTITISESEMSVEFKAFATSLKYETGKHLEDIRFSGLGMDLGDGKAQVDLELPSTCRISRALPHEVVTGGAKLTGSLRIVLELTLVPRAPVPPGQRVYQPKLWQEPGMDWLESLKPDHRGLYVALGVALVVLKSIGDAGAAAYGLFVVDPGMSEHIVDDSRTLL